MTVNKWEMEIALQKFYVIGFVCFQMDQITKILKVMLHIRRILLVKSCFQCKMWEDRRPLETLIIYRLFRDLIHKSELYIPNKEVSLTPLLTPT